MPGLCLSCQVSLGCLEHNALTINTSTAKPLALTGRVAVSGNRHILYNVKAQHSAALRTLLFAPVVLPEGTSREILLRRSPILRTFSKFQLRLLRHLTHRIECPMSKSEANQRSPRMVKEPHKTVSSAAVDITSGSKVSITVSRISEAKHPCVVCHIFTLDPEIYHVTRFTAKSDPRKTIYFLCVVCCFQHFFRGDRCWKSFLDGCWC